MVIIPILLTLAIQWLHQAMPSRHLLLKAGIGLTRRFHSTFYLQTFFNSIVSSLERAGVCPIL